MSLVESPDRFRHFQSAHCESGVAASLANHVGMAVSEPMAFGIGSGLFFANFPFIKVMGLPLTTFRSYPGTIMKKMFRRTGIPLARQKFRRPEKALKALDAMLANGEPAGVQLSVFWLPYLPEQFRFQFNAHHAVVCAKKDDTYIISDPMGEEKVVCPIDDFQRAWFAKGPLAPQGTLYSAMPATELSPQHLARAISAGIKENSNRMLRVPFPNCGVRGIRTLARQLPKWPTKLKRDRRVKLHLGQIVRMQEEIGTGGAGFRFLYAAFLQEASRLKGFEYLQQPSEWMTGSGDGWRSFAIMAAKACRGEVTTHQLQEMSSLLMDNADLEERCFRQMDKQHRSGGSAWN